jgi:hypothetical protein
MSHAATCYGPFTRRRRAFFFVRATQQVPSQDWVLRQLARETVRALAALAGAAAWGALLLLLAG